MNRILLFIFTLSALSVHSQDIPTDEPKTELTLDQCIEIALENNIDLKRTVNNLVAAESNKKQGYMNFLPDLNARVNYDMDFGTNFDNTAGEVTTSTFSSQPGIGSNLMIFNAFANHNLLKQRIQELTAAENALENQRLEVEVAVLANFLTVIIDRENVRISEQRLELLEGQYEREQKRESVGVGNMETVLNFKAQAATERLNLVNLTNTYRMDLLRLLQVLQIDNPINYTIAEFDIDNAELLVAVDPYVQVQDEILNYSFALKQSLATQSAAGYQLKQVRSNMYPNITANAYLGSRYTSNAEEEFTEQLKLNRGQGVGFTMSIPIFNQYANKNAVDRAKVSYLNAELTNKQTLLNVNNAIQRNYLDLVAAQTSYTTALETQDASSQTFEFVKKRFDNGNTDFYTYLESLNNKNRADAQLVNSKYSMVLRNRILNLYRGKE